MDCLKALSERWEAPGGYREVLKIAIPLVLSTGAWSIQHFVDRMFLTWYSPEAIAAAMPAGVLNFTLMSLFTGIAGYVSTFVAQYQGAGQPQRMGPIIWQGLYVSLIGGTVFIGLLPLAEPVFRFIGHEALICEYEIAYFRILCMGAFPALASSALAGFYSGRGKTWPVMWANLVATAVNMVFSYLLIFGNGGFPEMGISGAAVATVISGIFQCGIYLALMTRPHYNQRYRILAGWKWDRELFFRLLRFGLPSGVLFFIDVFGFTVFLLFLGRLGTTALAATNIAFNINTFAYMPMIGIGITISVLVGQYLGDNDPGRAEYSVYSGLQLTVLYMTLVAVSYVALPGAYLWFYQVGAEPAGFVEIRRITVVLLRFVALYSLFDSLNIIFSSALKGAGDTRYIMVMVGVLSAGLLVAPSYLALVKLGGSLYSGWIIITVYVIGLGFSFLWRFLGGKWKSMRVIEEIPPNLAEDVPGAILQ